MGDFNARKGNLLDSSVDSNNDFHLTHISEIADINVGAQTFVKMHLLDQAVNKYGRFLVNLCNSNNLSILNGRTRGDMLGKFTCYKSNGSSVTDYATVSSDLMKQMTNFSVLPLSVYSCHCPISFALKTKVFQIDKECNNFLLQKPSHFIWNNEKKNLYKLILNERQTRLKCDTIIDQITQNSFSSSSFDDTVTSVTEVLHHAAIKSFVLRKYRIKKKIGQTPKNKKWFDKDCETLKSELLSATRNLQRYPKDPIVRGRYHKLKKEYKRLVKYKKHSFREAILNKISDLEGNYPKAFWEMVNELKSNKDRNLADNIEPQEWYNWFKKLNTPQSTINESD